MAVFFFGTEGDAGWIRTNGNLWSTFTRNGDPFIRGGIKGSILSQSAVMQTPTFAKQSKLYTHVNVGTVANLAGGYLNLNNPTGYASLRLYFSPNDFELQEAASYDTTTGNVTYNIVTTLAHTQEIQIDLYTDFTTGSGGNGFVEISINKESEYSDSLNLTSFNTSGGFVSMSIEGGTQAPPGWSEFIIANESTLDYRVATLYPTADGTYAEQSGGNYTDIDELDNNDSDVVQYTTTGLRSSFQLSNLTSTAALYKPIAVAVGCRAKRDATGPTQVDIGIRTNSTDYYTSTASLNTGYLTFRGDWGTTNPQTGSAWTISEINALELIIRSS